MSDVDAQTPGSPPAGASPPMGGHPPTGTCPPAGPSPPAGALPEGLINASLRDGYAALKRDPLLLIGLSLLKVVLV